MLSQNQFRASLPLVYGPHKLLSIRSDKLLADMSSSEEEKLQDHIYLRVILVMKEKCFLRSFAIVTMQMI